MSLVLIGDVHGQVEKYRNIVSHYPHTLQIGDFGFEYGNIKVDPKYHKFFGGNHDNYDTIHLSPHNIGDFGDYTLGGVDFFFVRGAFSPDIVFRINELLRYGQKSWWKEEELTLSQSMECLQQYKATKPKIVITHTCPTFILDQISNPHVMRNYGFEGYVSHTNQLLQLMWEAHQPQLWFFGHFHIKFSHTVHHSSNSTTFMCLPPLGVYKIER